GVLQRVIILQPVIHESVDAESKEGNGPIVEAQPVGSAKFQSAKLQRRSKFQSPNGIPGDNCASSAANWRLVFGYSLVIGPWSLELPRRWRREAWYELA